MTDGPRRPELRHPLFAGFRSQPGQATRKEDQMSRKGFPARRNAWMCAAAVMVVCCLAHSSLVLADDQPAPAAVPAPAPPTKVTVEDQPNDAGSGLIVTWSVSPDDPAALSDEERKGLKPLPRHVVRYLIERKNLKPPVKKHADAETSGPDGSGEAGDTGETAAAEFRQVGEKTVGEKEFVDSGVNLAGEYVYRVRAVSLAGGISEPSEESAPAVPVLQYFDESKLWRGVLLLLVCGTVVYFIEVARSGRELKVRRIAGLEAVDEAVGRATEMGRSCLFVPGIMDINDMQTVAGITVLSRVATSIAEYDAELVVPTSRSLVMTTARETVEAAYLSAGRPDAYREDQIYYLTDEQFGYVAGVTGTMVREKPAACFYLGAFYAESLLLAETGNSIGAIQVAGTAMPSQLPFFVAACDYTLIGEEFFAASAYLSGEPHQLGSLKGQDGGKLLAGLLILLGCLLATLLQFVNPESTGGLHQTLESVLTFLTGSLLGGG